MDGSMFYFYQKLDNQILCTRYKLEKDSIVDVSGFPSANQTSDTGTAVGLKMVIPRGILCIYDIEIFTHVGMSVAYQTENTRRLLIVGRNELIVKTGITARSVHHFEAILIANEFPKLSLPVGHHIIAHHIFVNAKVLYHRIFVGKDDIIPILGSSIAELGQFVSPTCHIDSQSEANQCQNRFKVHKRQRIFSYSKFTHSPPFNQTFVSLFSLLSR